MRLRPYRWPSRNPHIRLAAASQQGSTLRDMIKKLATAALTGTLVLGAGSLAWAETGSQPSGSQPSAPHQRAGGLLRRAEHGDLTVRTKNGFEQLTFDRGRVTAVSATS